MGRIGFEEAKQFETQNALFKLANDGDEVLVKFLINGLADVFVYMVHPIKFNGSYTKAACLRSDPNAPVSTCPFCSIGANENRMMLRYYIPVYNFTEGCVQFWERGARFKSKLMSICQHFGNELPFNVFTIHREGKAGDADTNYKITCDTENFVENIDSFGDKEELTMLLDSTPEKVFEYFSLSDNASNPIYGLIQSRTSEDMDSYINNGKFDNDSFDYSTSRSGGSNNFASRTPNYTKRASATNDYSSRIGGDYSSRRSDSNDEDDSPQETRFRRRDRPF